MFLPLKVTGLIDGLRLFFRDFSILFFFSLLLLRLLLRCLCLLLEFDRDLARLFLSRLLDRERDLLLSQFLLWCRFSFERDLEWLLGLEVFLSFRRCLSSVSSDNRSRPLSENSSRSSDPL